MWVIRVIAVLGMLGIFLQLLRLVPESFWCGLRGSLQAFWRWLKGSRVLYFFEKGSITREEVKALQDRAVIFDGPQIAGSSIEISHGPFKSQSATRIHSRGSMLWTLTRDWENGNDTWVQLEDARGIPVKTALRLINTYPSLKAMLDRIAELEKADASRKQLWSATRALLNVIDSDRKDEHQRYRSSVVQGIRVFLEKVDEFARIPQLEGPDPEMTIDWEKLLRQKLSELSAQKARA